MPHKILNLLGDKSDAEVVVREDGRVFFCISTLDRHRQGREHFLAGASVMVESVRDAVEFARYLRDEGLTIPNDIDEYEERP
jgi:hypothetical protein